MSIESAKAFIERIKTDEDFKNRVSTAEDLEARIALAKAEGFDFSAEDMNAVKSELPEDDLAQIAAGTCLCDFGGGKVGV
jgi:predicted ribosomally synthesized peptide with nif11-like leader